MTTCIVQGCGNPAVGLQCDEHREGRAPTTRTSPAVSTPRGRPEEAIRLEIKRWYRLVGAAVWDTEQNRPDPRVDAGLSDLIVLWPGRGVRFVEVKSETGKQRDSQRDFEAACTAAGEPYLLARSLEDVQRFEAAFDCP